MKLIWYASSEMDSTWCIMVPPCSSKQALQGICRISSHHCSWRIRIEKFYTHRKTLGITKKSQTQMHVEPSSPSYRYSRHLTILIMMAITSGDIFWGLSILHLHQQKLNVGVRDSSPSPWPDDVWINNDNVLESIQDCFAFNFTFSITISNK